MVVIFSIIVIQVRISCITWIERRLKLIILRFRSFKKYYRSPSALFVLLIYILPLLYVYQILQNFVFLLLLLFLLKKEMKKKDHIYIYFCTLRNHWRFEAVKVLMQYISLLIIIQKKEEWDVGLAIARPVWLFGLT